MSMAKEALKIWLDLPVDVRGKILSNVWCPDCSTAVTICDYSADLDGGVVVLRGFCGTCGHKVARVLEGCGESPKKKSKCALEYYIFDIWLYGDEKCTDKKRIVRKIQIAGTKSLYNFAKVITQAFGFYFDHCFGFYDTLKDKLNCKKAFELFVDIGEKLIFLFDYGDGWQFNVELKEIRKGDKGTIKPVVIESIGKAPLQYPPCEKDSKTEQ